MTSISSTTYYSPMDRYAASMPASANGGDTYADVVTDRNAKSEAGGSSAATGSPEAAVDTSPSTVTVALQGKLVSLNLLKVDLSKAAQFDPATLPEDRYQDYMETEQTFMDMEKRALEIQHTQYSEPDLSNYGGSKPYATINVGGQVVATIDNQGVVQTQSNSLGSKLKDILIGDVNGTNGPDLAQTRAEQIAKMLGGKVTKASTAMTQSQFNLLPSTETKVTVDYDAVVSDPAYAELQKRYQNYQDLQQKRTEYLAQQQSAN